MPQRVIQEGNELVSRRFEHVEEFAKMEQGMDRLNEFSEYMNEQIDTR